jgi:hypothetical protein
MKRLWIFRPWFPYEIGLERMSRHCYIANHMELFSAGFQVGEFRSSLPVTKLKLTLKDFRTDCFMWESRTFVSERMREVMALGPSDIQYFEVDADESAPLPKSMNYKIMVVPVTEDASDPAGSVLRDEELPESERMMNPAGRISIRPKFTPVHQIFHDKGTLEPFCTDEFALRVLKAGCTGARFCIPRSLSVAEPPRFRTLKGVEEEGAWDSVRRTANTSLVEPIR